MKDISYVDRRWPGGAFHVISSHPLPNADPWFDMAIAQIGDETVMPGSAVRVSPEHRRVTIYLLAELGLGSEYIMSLHATHDEAVETAREVASMNGHRVCDVALYVAAVEVGTVVPVYSSARWEKVL